jgi:hypothetical protein
VNHSALLAPRTWLVAALAALGVAAGPSPAVAADPAQVVDATEERDAKAEALFMAAEKKREVAEQVVLPPYAGPGDRASVLKYLNTEGAGWSVRKLWAIEEAERAYLKIFWARPPVGASAPVAPATADHHHRPDRR